MNVSEMKCLNEREAADCLGLSVHTLRKWRQLRKGPRYLKIAGAARNARGRSGRVLYRPADLIAFLEAVAVPTEEPLMPDAPPSHSRSRRKR